MKADVIEADLVAEVTERPLACASHRSHSSPKVAPGRCVTPTSAAATMSRSTPLSPPLDPRTLRVA